MKPITGLPRTFLSIGALAAGGCLIACSSPTSVRFGHTRVEPVTLLPGLFLAISGGYFLFVRKDRGGDT